MTKQKLLQALLALALVAGIWGGTISWVERSRTMEGTWVDLFEGSKFFEGETLSQSCRGNFWGAPWFSFYPPPKSKLFEMLDSNARTRPGNLVISDSIQPVAAYRIKFVGHKNVSKWFGLFSIMGFGYGHLSASGSEVEVEHLISIDLIPDAICNVR